GSCAAAVDGDMWEVGDRRGEKIVVAERARELPVVMITALVRVNVASVGELSRPTLPECPRTRDVQVELVVGIDPVAQVDRCCTGAERPAMRECTVDPRLQGRVAARLRKTARDIVTDGGNRAAPVLCVTRYARQQPGEQRERAANERPREGCSSHRSAHHEHGSGARTRRRLSLAAPAFRFMGVPRFECTPVNLLEYLERAVWFYAGGTTVL